MLPSPVVRECPGVELSRDIKRPFRSQPRFQAQIWAQHRIREQIGLHRQILRSGSQTCTGNYDSKQHKDLFHYRSILLCQ